MKDGDCPQRVTPAADVWTAPDMRAGVGRAASCRLDPSAAGFLSHITHTEVNTMDDQRRYEAAAHAMQSGVAVEMGLDP